MYLTLTDLEFTVVVPSVDISTINKDRLKEFIFEHLIPGEAFTTFNEEDLYGNSNNHLIKFTHLSKHNESIWALNDFKILRTAVLNKQCSVIYIDGVLGDKRTLFSKRNIHDNNRYVWNYMHPTLLNNAEPCENKNIFDLKFYHFLYTVIMNHRNLSGKMQPKRKYCHPNMNSNKMHWLTFWWTWRLEQKFFNIFSWRPIFRI